VENFERTLKREFQQYWKSRHPVRLDSQLLNNVMNSISHFSGPIGPGDEKL
jgi:hypothetical protein